jgi:hypothetical protein
MLGKLIKHEFRATARIMWPVLAALLVLGVLGNVSTRLLSTTSNGLVNVLASLVMVAFVFAVMGVSILALVLMVNRFKTNLLSDEGYLMFTLPVSVHALVWSKLLVSLLWFVLSAIAMVLSMLVLSFRVEFLSHFAEMLRALFQFRLPDGTAGHVALVITEMVGAALMGGVCLCLLFYAAMSAGHSFGSHKKLLTAVSFLVLLIITQFGATYFLALVFRGYMNAHVADFLSSLQFSAGALGWILLAEAIFAGLYYAVTTLCLRYRLDLE